MEKDQEKEKKEWTSPTCTEMPTYNTEGTGSAGPDFGSQLS